MISYKVWEIWENRAFWLAEMSGHMIWGEIWLKCKWCHSLHTCKQCYIYHRATSYTPLNFPGSQLHLSTCLWKSDHFQLQESSFCDAFSKVNIHWIHAVSNVWQQLQLLSNYQKPELCLRFTKKELDMMRFQVNEVNFEVRCHKFQTLQNAHKMMF